MTNKPVKCVVLPARPPIDKYVAYKRVMMDLQRTYRVRVAFCDVNMPTPEHFRRYANMCSENGGPAYFIDVGVQKYHNLGPSASEIEMKRSDTESSRTMRRLVELTNKNNQNGGLRSRPHAIAKLIRGAYEVMLNGDASQEIVFNRGMDVVNAFFYRQDRREWATLFSEEKYSDLIKLWQGFDVPEGEVLPFTLPLYFRQMFNSGRSVAEITEKMSWWTDKDKRIKERKKAASEKKYLRYMFSVCGRPAALVHVENVFEAEAFKNQYLQSGDLALGIVRNQRGQAHIQPSRKYFGLDMDPLAKVLIDKEPGRWYYEKRFHGSPALMNGSAQYVGVTATSETDQGLMLLSSRHTKFNFKY